MTLSRLERGFAQCLRVLTRVFLTIFIFVLPERQRPNATNRVSSAKNPLLLLSGVQLARRIRRREVSCVEVIQAYISRIEAVNPLVNAVVKDRFASALQEADQVDKLVAEESEDEASLEEKFPLLGVPLSVKESIALQGMPNSSGLVSRRDVVSHSDAAVVSLLKRAGAVPLGVTNCSELCMWLESSNNVYGRSNNPYSLDRIVGGSSGGEGCILASAGSVIGIGSDIGGSIRMPAFFNGVFGHKPTIGVVPNEGQFPNASGPQVDFLCTGPLCRYAEDLAPLLRIMAGPQAERLNLSEEVNLKQVKFYSMVHDGGSLFVSPVDRQLVDAQYQLIERLEADLGVKVQQVQIPEFKYAFQIWAAMMSSKNADGKAAQSFTGLMGDHGKPVWPLWELLKWILGLSYHTLPAIGLGLAEKLQSSKPSNDLLKKTQALRREMERLLGSDGVFLYPSHPKIAPKHHHPIFTPFNFIYTGIFNILGLPVTQCPLGLSTEGLPLGIQLVSNLYNDRLSIATARYVETAFGGWRDPGKS
ncbi:fatty-acid amide hydrolase 2-B [Acipenser ruthenus]|uniref:fatty-acid amide hydrolase 2-B n=1 Tax=Acipenser ruthenus TaxID=7906 RepID=UPI00145ABA94|nr:fatty-acid amide hydrolase 2-B [Acipenser ruthenus]